MHTGCSTIIRMLTVILFTLQLQIIVNANTALISQKLEQFSSEIIPIERSILKANDAKIKPDVNYNDTFNITTQIGTHAYLPCQIRYEFQHNKSVSWIRVRDEHILTVDSNVFIADQRFLVVKDPAKFWTLQIKYVQLRDAGSYECQVSTEPKLSARVHLNVIVPRTEILGDSDRYVKEGSTVLLRCIVRESVEPINFIIWYHGSEQLPAKSLYHHTKIDGSFSPELANDKHSIIGSLIIESARKSDSGNYTCSPSNSPSATLMLNVINGESSASAVTSTAPITEVCSGGILTLLFSIRVLDKHRTW